MPLNQIRLRRQCYNYCYTKYHETKWWLHCKDAVDQQNSTRSCTKDRFGQRCGRENGIHVRNCSRNREYKTRCYNQNPKPRDISSLLIIDADIKRSFAKCFPKKKMLCAFRTTKDTYTSNSSQGKSQKKSKLSGNRVLLDLKQFADGIDPIERITWFWWKTCPKQKRARM